MTRIRGTLGGIPTPPRSNWLLLAFIGLQVGGLVRTLDNWTAGSTPSFVGLLIWTISVTVIAYFTKPPRTGEEGELHDYIDELRSKSSEPRPPAKPDQFEQIAARP